MMYWMKLSALRQETGAQGRPMIQQETMSNKASESETAFMRSLHGLNSS